MARARSRGWGGRREGAGRKPLSLTKLRSRAVLTAGVQLGYISEQLGHANVAVTAQHYARWAGGKAYRRPLEVQDCEVPADLIARIEVIESPHSSPQLDEIGAS